MVKFLLIIFLVSYLVYKVGGFFFKMLVMKTVQNQQKQYNPPPKSKRPSGGNVNIDYMPDSKNDKRSSSNSGEYVDFEEVKD